MNILNKYKTNLYINLDGFLEYEINKKRLDWPLNYIFNRKFNIIKNFIYFYSVFLILLPFSVYQHKNNQEFKININSSSMLLLDENYDYFFYSYK